MTEASSSIGRVPVSKTGCWGFKSLLACQIEAEPAPDAQTYGLNHMEKVRTKLQDIRNFFDEVGAEMKKTTWPTRRELLSTTVVVIVAIFILSVVVGFSDKLLSVLLRALLMRG